MNTKSKITINLIGMTLIMFILIVLNIIYNFRENGVKSIDNKAQVLSETVKHTLTSQMVNGVIQNRELFLSQIEDLESIEKVWLSRAPAVVSQYGKGFNNEVAKDSIDEKVLRTGESIKVIEDRLFAKSSYRITIPYNATQEGSINCMECHIAKEGETLGAITIKMSIDDAKGIGITTVVNTTIILLILMIVILIFIHNIVGPFLDIFDSIKNVMEKAQKGDYSARIEFTKSVESKEVAKWINTFLEKLQITLSDIEKNINIFLVKDKNESKDPLLKVKSTVSRLSEIYKFRKTIEHDEKLDDVYFRVAYILKTVFKLEDFFMYEANTISGELRLVYVEKEIHCDAINKGCRADRTNTLIDSCQFEGMCSEFSADKNIEHICIPYSISNDLDLILSITTYTKEEAGEVRERISLIKDYIDASRTEIISKKLMAKLERNANMDALTGLYNRKYLEDSVEKIISQADRSKVKFGVLMIDIDFFKKVNDTYGHAVGDDAIRVLAQTLNESTRNSDILVRYGGEEFVILLYDCKENEIEGVAEKIRTNFASKKIPVSNTHISKTISVGTSTYPKDSSDLWQCIKFADLALYEAKNSGRDRVIAYKEALSNKKL